MIMFNDHEYAAADAVLTPENRFHAAARLATRRWFLRVATPGELRADLAETNSEPRSPARGGLVGW